MQGQVAVDWATNYKKTRTIGNCKCCAPTRSECKIRNSRAETNTLDPWCGATGCRPARVKCPPGQRKTPAAVRPGGAAGRPRPRRAPACTQGAEGRAEGAEGGARRGEADGEEEEAHDRTSP
ncbi:unnamed protein product [Prorocentrum cordatum]|uniref:Uncharacterized protein n=1 Tax=Prorocentrum cordatum TaxID=2364126 RepID=A0ABN9SA78_9DINO|nr:unnamed protein product [Polarella glacialis]